MLKYLLCLVILVASVYVSREYIKGRKSSLELVCEHLALLEHLLSRMSLSIAPVSSFLTEYNSVLLEKLGFLGALREGASPYEAFIRFGGEIADTESRALLSRLYLCFGEGEYTQELSRLEECTRALSSRVSVLCEEHEKHAKVVTTLTVGASVGIIILLL